MTRVLVVDDKADNLYLLRTLLEGHGYVVDEDRHGAEALARARGFPPDLTVSDLTVSDLLMPVMDGYTLLRHWRVDERLQGIPFVVYTATYTDPKDERLALDLGADAFLVKPAEPDVFVARVREVLVRKLEDKARQLEQANAALREDVERRRRTEEALRLRDRAIAAASQGILITDAALPGRPVVYVSPGMERTTGRRPEDVLGRAASLLQGEDVDPRSAALLAEAYREGRPCTVEFLNRRPDGKPFWTELSVSPIRDADGRLTHFVEVWADVTVRRSLEEQLRHAQKMEAVGRLAGGVAHDFNNLLTVIIGYSDLLLETLPADDRSRGLVAEVRQAGERSAGLTRQLLAFSRRQVLAPRALGLNAVVSDAEKLLRRLIGEHVQLVVGLPPGLGTVWADPGQIEQVLMNLVVNARDAMPDGGRITIETRDVDLDEAFVRGRPEARSGPHVLLSVTDEGCGMTPEVKARIFEPFFTTKAPGKGTGLGLATVYGIVEQSGGCVSVRSEAGLGTTFEVYLPRTEAASDERGRPGAAAAPPRGSETVLLVEDDDGVRALSRHVLVGCGYVVLEAAGGDEALRIADSHAGPIHLLAIDVVMPGAGGRKVAAEVARRRPESRTLFVSGYADDALLRQGILQDGVHFLQKPFPPNALALKVREVLDAAP